MERSTVTTVRRLPRIRMLRGLSVLLGAACLALFAGLLLRFEDHAMWQGLSALGSVVPLLLLLELCRAGCELCATRALLGSDFHRVPRLRFARAQLLAQCFDVVLPAGRAAAESSKAVLYARDLGWPLAAAIGTALQLAVLGANALWVIVAYGACLALPVPAGVRTGLLIYATGSGAIVLGSALFAAAPRVRALCERVPLLQASLTRFADILATARLRLSIALGAQLASRMLQALQLWAAAVALGAAPSLSQAMLTQAVYLVGAALGELVPAQLGTTDAAFVLAAPALGLGAVAAFSITLALHAVQLAVALLAGLGAILVSCIESRAAAGEPRLSHMLRAAEPTGQAPDARYGVGAEP